MKNELEENLYKNFPLLYSEHKLPMSHTCMCWGFSCGDGWYDLIYNLSSKLEPLIKKQMNDVKFEDKTCFCGCNLSQHTKSAKGLECRSIFKLPYHPFNRIWHIIPKSKSLAIYKSIIQRIKIWINSFCYFISPIIYKNVPCRCKGYEEYHATASQVKEKYGTLHFYTNGFTDKMNELVNKAEVKSQKICEICGKPGKLRGGGWIQVLCKKCNEKNNEEKNDE